MTTWKRRSVGGVPSGAGSFSMYVPSGSGKSAYLHTAQSTHDFSQGGSRRFSSQRESAVGKVAVGLGVLVHGQRHVIVQGVACGRELSFARHRGHRVYLRAEHA
jgi:hypothetical protein